MNPHFLILTGDGINCENETALALESAEIKTTIKHVNQFLAHPQSLLDYQGLVLPGGFSFGDELGSGQVMALKLRHQLKDQLLEFISRDRAVLGICNGFQMLVKLGILPNRDLEKPQAALLKNDHGRFQNKWVELEVAPSHKCRWVPNDLKTLYVPIRHGEGRFVSDISLADLESNGQVVFRYRADVNGSLDRIAGICDPTGWILGLMPHPEAASFSAQIPERSRPPEGQKLFYQIRKSLRDC